MQLELLHRETGTPVAVACRRYHFCGNTEIEYAWGYVTHELGEAQQTMFSVTHPASCPEPAASKRQQLVDA